MPSRGSNVQALAGFCLLLFVVTVSGVGARMLGLARRTRGRPELLMGASMMLVGTIGFPIGLVSGFGGPVGTINLPVGLAGTCFTQLGLGLIYAFTCQVFRPDAAWGKAVTDGSARLRRERRNGPGVPPAAYLAFVRGREGAEA